MSDTSTAPTSDEAPGSDADAGSNPKQTIEYWQGEAHKAFGARDAAKEALREAQAKISQLEAGQPRETPKKKGDSEPNPEVERLNALLADSQKETETLRQSVRSKSITEKFGAIAADRVHKLVSVTAQMQAEGFQLDIVGDDENLVVILPDGTRTYDVDKWLDKYLTENSHLAKNPRAKGTDTKGPIGVVTARTLVDLEKMSPDEQRKFAIENPKLAAEILSKTRLPG